MKIWIKLLLGLALGVVLGSLFPQFESTYSSIGDIVNNIGRYGLYPLLFFSLPLAVLELRKEKKIFQFFGRTILYLLLSSLVLVVIGTLTVLLLAPDRIPIIIEAERTITLPGFREILQMVFPRNLFTLLNNDGNYLLPIYFFSFFLGLNFFFDRIVTRPAVQLFDSFSRIFYHINSFIVELIGIGAIALSSSWIVSITNAADLEIFHQTILLLGINAGIVIFGIYPVIIYFATNRENPYKWLYGLIAPVLTAFFSGNLYFSLPSLIHHGKENLGIPRKAGISSFPLFAIFGKAGTALVTGLTFLIIIKSYSSLGISVSTFFWVIGFSYLTSFISGPLPGMGVYASLVVLCGLYGQGIEEGYLILSPVMPILISFASAIDILTAGLATLLSAKHEGFVKEVRVTDFV